MINESPNLQCHKNDSNEVFQTMFINSELYQKYIHNKYKSRILNNFLKYTTCLKSITYDLELDTNIVKREWHIGLNGIKLYFEVITNYKVKFESILENELEAKKYTLYNKETTNKLYFIYNNKKYTNLETIANLIYKFPKIINSNIIILSFSSIFSKQELISLIVSPLLMDSEIYDYLPEQILKYK